MLKSFAARLSGVVVSVVAVLPLASAHAQDNCQFYDTTGEVVDVFKTPSTQQAYFELLERGDVTCITELQRRGKRSWGFIKYRKDKNGQKVVVNGWVDLQFMARQGGVATVRELEQGTGA